MNQQNQEQMRHEHYRLQQLQVIAIEKTNEQMEKIALNYLNSGIAKTTHDAARITCERHGREMAAYLQENLRLLGAKDCIVTCP